MQLLRRILQRIRPTVLLLALGLFACLWLATAPVHACWNYVENQCWIYPNVPANWGPNGLNHPAGTNRYWWRYPNPPYDPGPLPPPPRVTWDIENQIYDGEHMCQGNIQAIWCDGWPRTHDPRFDNYPPWDSAYVTYGPIDLTQAVAAAASFYLYQRSELVHDSLFFGAIRGTGPNAKKVHLQPRDSVYIGGVACQIMENMMFQQRVIDLSRLRRLSNGDSVSLLGSNDVYLFWRFWSDGNNNVNTGSFIDNISIAWDDGGVNLQGLSASLKKMDSTLWGAHLIPMDTAFATFTWMSCSGGTGLYPTFEIVGTVDTSVVLDTIITTCNAGDVVTLTTRPFVLLPDTHRIRFVVDTLNSVNETIENDNAYTYTYWVPPIHPAPTFTWVVPGSETGNVYGDQNVILRWECYHDPAVPATLTFQSNADGNTCTGVNIPGGVDVPVIDGPDSLVWPLTAYNYNRVLYPYVKVHDAFNDTCIHAPFPVIRRPLAAGDRPESLIPERFYLEQNSPNPFNPTTELRYGLAKAGSVSLKVYDLLGREVAVLVNGEQSPGAYRVNFDGGALPSGLYLYKLTTPEGTMSRKMMLMK